MTIPLPLRAINQNPAQAREARAGLSNLVMVEGTGRKRCFRLAAQ